MWGTQFLPFLFGKYLFSFHRLSRAEPGTFSTHRLQVLSAQEPLLTDQVPPEQSALSKKLLESSTSFFQFRLCDPRVTHWDLQSYLSLAIAPQWQAILRPS